MHLTSPVHFSYGVTSPRHPLAAAANAALAFLQGDLGCSLALHSACPHPHALRSSVLTLSVLAALRQCPLQNSSPTGTPQSQLGCLHWALLSR